MKIFHLSDLHIGRQLNYYNLKESQKKVFEMIEDKTKEEKPDVIVIAGDIYDKAVPSGEAYELFDEFLNDLADIRPSIPVLIIAGNHDNASRLNFASSFLKKNNIYISVMPPKTEEEYLQKIQIEDQYGPVNFYLLPFTKPSYVREFLSEEEKHNYHAAVEKVLEHEAIDDSERNVLVAHQFFVSGTKEPGRSDSESYFISVGGLDSVDISCVEQFDYVALGHIHRPQIVSKEHIRYCGTPLKYSVSEQNHKKGILMVTLGEKGSENKYETLPLVVKPDVRKVKGTLEEVIAMATDENRDDYVSITLTDELLDRPKDKLEEHYSKILEILVDNRKTKSMLEEESEEGILDPMDAFLDFYTKIEEKEPDQEHMHVIREVVQKAKEREEVEA